MKKFLTFVLLLTSFAPMVQAESSKKLGCILEDNLNGNDENAGLFDIPLKRQPNSEGESEETLALPTRPNLFVTVWSYPDVLKRGQRIDLRLRTKKQLNTGSMLAWTSSVHSATLGLHIDRSKNLDFISILCYFE